MSARKVKVAVTLGDPGGIGPEIVEKALSLAVVREALEPVVIGNTQNGSYRTGEVAAENGRAAHAWIVEAAKLAIDGQVDAICTAPISKEAMFAAGFKFPGHTELLAELCGVPDVRMMLEGGGLRVVLQTIHVALTDVPSQITEPKILNSLRILNDWQNQFSGYRGEIAVCGLNPHAGEGGHFGQEEKNVIVPAIRAAQKQGYLVSGPFPADTVFHRALNGEFSLILAMYHDQALIPIKTLDFHRGVNVTVGLPIIRTSPDHGTAFELAGKRVANEKSMVSALLKAAELARQSKTHKNKRPLSPEQKLTV